MEKRNLQLYTSKTINSNSTSFVNPSNSNDFIAYNINTYESSNIVSNEVNNMSSSDLPIIKYTINHSLTPITSIPKYIRYPDSKYIQAYIVNVHDAINFDIDMSGDGSPLKPRYESVISNVYSYYEVPGNFYTNPDFSILYNGNRNSRSCRCRLRGISVKNTESFHRNNYKMTLEVKKLIDRTDGWVFAKFGDVDIYRRLLIDIIVPIPNDPINLREFLLQYYPDFYSAYPTKKGHVG
jgi:hypothetical protein